MRVFENLLLAALIVAGVAMMCAGLNPTGNFQLMTIAGAIALGSSLISLTLRNTNRNA